MEKEGGDSFTESVLIEIALAAGAGDISAAASEIDRSVRCHPADDGEVAELNGEGEEGD